EGGVGEEAQTDDARGISVVRAHRDGRPARTDLHAGILLLVLEGIGLAVATLDPFVEPEAEAVRPRARGLLEAALVHEAIPFPAGVAAPLDGGMVRDGLQQVEV